MRTAVSRGAVRRGRMVSRDLTAVLRIAAKYGVLVLPLDERTELPDGASRGPRGHACHPATKTVWFEPEDGGAVQTRLHEICHVIMTPPFGEGIDEFDESVLLMPVRANAGAAVPVAGRLQGGGWVATRHRYRLVGSALGSVCIRAR